MKLTWLASYRDCLEPILVVQVFCQVRLLNLDEGLLIWAMLLIELLVNGNKHFECSPSWSLRDFKAPYQMLLCKAILFA